MLYVVLETTEGCVALVLVAVANLGPQAIPQALGDGPVTAPRSSRSVR